MIDRIVRAVARRRAELELPVPAGIAVRRSRWIAALAGRLAGLRRAAAAVTLGRTIVVHPEVRVGARLLRHELAHVRQWERYGPLFPVLYVWNHLRHGYEQNPFEVEARAAEQVEDAGEDLSCRRTEDVSRGKSQHASGRRSEDAGGGRPGGGTEHA